MFTQVCSYIRVVFNAWVAVCYVASFPVLPPQPLLLAVQLRRFIYGKGWHYSYYKTIQLYVWERATKKSIHWGAFPPIASFLSSWPCTQKAWLQASCLILQPLLTWLHAVLCNYIYLPWGEGATWLHSVHEIAVQISQSPNCDWWGLVLTSCTVGDIA